jgi:hypothetical protein
MFRGNNMRQADDEDIAEILVAAGVPFPAGELAVT